MGVVVVTSFVWLLCQCWLISSAPTPAVAAAADYATRSSRPPTYPVEEHIFHSIIDHYNFLPTEPSTFPLRFYVSDHRRKDDDSGLPQPDGPCFFYAGNEADIHQFIDNSGSMFEMAEDFGALVVFAEHRYYGRSNPFGNEYALGVPYNVSFLTVEQAMADFNLLTVHLRKMFGMNSSAAFVAFGGSYGANLALWLRLKHPNLWAGAIASSATPLKHVLRETNGFARILTEAYYNVSSRCPDLVRTGWVELYDGVRTADGRRAVSDALGLCRAALPDPSAADDVHGWIGGALETMVQYGYPYPSSFYEPLPGYPHRVACRAMLESSAGGSSSSPGLGALRAAANVYYNWTGQAGECFEFDKVLSEARSHWERRGQVDKLYRQEVRIRERHDNNRAHCGGQLQHLHPTSEQLRGRRRRMQQGTDIGKKNWTETDEGWSYQCCTEVYQPMPTNGITDFEIPYIPNETEYFLRCRQRWGGVVPRPNWEELTFMGADIGAAGSNIFLTNGQLDPWRAAGIQEVPRNAPPSIFVRTLEGAAHHLDLRATNDLDPPSVVAVRQEQRSAIRQWIEEWKDIVASR